MTIIANKKLVLEVLKLANGYVLNCHGIPDHDDAFLASDEAEARVYLECWLREWFSANKVERIREVI